MNRQTTVLLAVAGCTALVIYLSSGGAESNRWPMAGAQPMPTAPADPVEPAPLSGEPDGTPRPAAVTGPAATATAPAAPFKLPATRSELNQLADGPMDLAGKMKVLGVMMRESAGPDAAAAAQRAIYIVKHRDYREHLQPLLISGDIKPEALEVLSLNAYDRPLDILLPLWSEIRQRSGHPLQAAAADGLEFHLGEASAMEGDGLAEAIRGKLQPEGSPAAAR
jgi:hypothetical protein